MKAVKAENKAPQEKPETEKREKPEQSSKAEGQHRGGSRRRRPRKPKAPGEKTE